MIRVEFWYEIYRTGIKVNNLIRELHPPDRLPDHLDRSLFCISSIREAGKGKIAT
jgi:hypothetical protein